MFANRFTALVDDNVLVSPLKRNLLLTLAAADFFRIRWSERILDEVERAVAKLVAERGEREPDAVAKRARAAMERAFEDAVVTGYRAIERGFAELPDPDDRHVLAAAVKTKAHIIVTDNRKDFPERVLTPLDIEAKRADAFIADTITLDEPRAVHAIAGLRGRLRNPSRTADDLLVAMERAGLTATVDVLRSHVRSL